MNKFNKVLVVCPGNTVTGGPEALHHLVHELRQINVDAFIVYFPFTSTFDVPEPYRDFDVKVGRYEDSVGDLIVFPEIYPKFALSVKNAKAAIWWLSVDNFLERRHISKIRDKLRYIKRVLQLRRPLRGFGSLAKLIHFSQSEYASETLRQHRLVYTNLFEPINKRFLLAKLDSGISGRENEILFNPVKGRQFTERLMSLFPHYKFTPLKGFTKDELTKKFQSAKVYIDFGHHPGRDRIPREAAIHGCCIVTNLSGSAGNDVDIPIDRQYKIDTLQSGYEEKFDSLVRDIFDNFPSHYLKFSGYRERIREESGLFKMQIAKFFDKPNI